MKKKGIVETVVIGRVIIFSITFGVGLNTLSDKLNEKETIIIEENK